MIVIELAELFSEWGFYLSTNPGQGDQSIVGLHYAGWYLGRGANEMSPCRGVGVYEQSINNSASCPIFFLDVNTLKDFCTGVGPYSVVLALYTNS